MMKRICISMLVLGALSLTACATGSELGDDIDDVDVDVDEEMGEPSREAEESDEEITAPPEPDQSGTLDVDDNVTTEKAACAALVDHQATMSAKLQCGMRPKACPSYLREMTGYVCVEYDKSSVSACVNAYKAATSCEELARVIDGCSVKHYPGTHTVGCH